MNTTLPNPLKPGANINAGKIYVDKRALCRYINDQHEPFPELQERSTRYSHIARSNPYWLIDIASEDFENTLDLLLQNHEGNWTWLRIPANHYGDPGKIFGVHKNGKATLRICCNDTSYLKQRNYKSVKRLLPEDFRQFVQRVDIPYRP